jgi:hypothetical protein
MVSVITNINMHLLNLVLPGTLQAEWQRKANMPSKRSDFSATVVPNLNAIVVIGGCNGDQICPENAGPDVYCYCPSITANAEMFFPENDTVRR